MSPITPAGHSIGVTSRQRAREHKGCLEGALEEFCRLCRENPLSSSRYRSAFDLVGDDASIEEAHSLLMDGRFPLDAGLFLSAVYARSDEQVLVYDLDTPLTYVGYMLPAEKLLVNRGNAGLELGSRSMGVIVNCGTSGNLLGVSTRGLVVNAGEAGEDFGMCSERGIAIALEEPASYDSFPFGGSTMLIPDGIPPDLKRYLDELVHACNGPPASISEKYGETPGIQISHAVRTLIGAHYGVRL